MSLTKKTADKVSERIEQFVDEARQAGASDLKITEALRGAADELDGSNSEDSE